MRKLDLTGERFGHLLVISQAPYKVFGTVKHVAWNCECACGEAAVVEAQKLRSGHTQSCGCVIGYRLTVGSRSGSITLVALLGDHRWACRCDCGTVYEITSSNFRNSASCGCMNPGNKTHGRTGTPEYYSWRNALVRCFWPKSKSFANYGARGITMCERWRTSFAAFFADMGPRQKGYSLERKDVNGNYEPGNCIWIPHRKQTRNRRCTLRSGDLTIIEIAEQRGLSYYTLRMAAKRGEDPLTFIPRRSNRRTKGTQTGTPHRETQRTAEPETTSSK